MANVLIAGATGNLGKRIANELLAKGAEVRALVRDTSDATKVNELENAGIKVIKVNEYSIDGLKEACNGVTCVVSALQGLRDVIIDAQTALLKAAVEAGVPRFIPSDFSSDFTRLPAGENRNFDLRREFHNELQKTTIKSTSIYNGAFANVLTYNIPVLDFKKKMVGYWGDDENYRLDFTTMDDTAAFTAAASMDNSTPKSLCIASFQISPAELAKLAGELTGTTYQLVRMGSVNDLAAYNKRERAAHPEGENELYSRWQSSQYMQSMFSVQNTDLDNDRYGAINWMSAKDFIGNFLQHMR